MSCRRCPSACWSRALCCAEGKVCSGSGEAGHWDDGAGSVFVFVVGILYSLFGILSLCISYFSLIGEVCSSGG